MLWIVLMFPSTNLLGFFVRGVFFWCFGNIGVILVAILLMIARLPDLLWEIKTDERTATKLTMQRLRLTHISILDHLSNFL